MTLTDQQTAQLIDLLGQAKQGVGELVAGAAAGTVNQDALFHMGLEVAKRLLICRALLGVPPDSDKRGAEPC